MLPFHLIFFSVALSVLIMMKVNGEYKEVHSVSLSPGCHEHLPKQELFSLYKLTGAQYLWVNRPA